MKYIIASDNVFLVRRLRERFFDDFLCLWPDYNFFVVVATALHWHRKIDIDSINFEAPFKDEMINGLMQYDFGTFRLYSHASRHYFAAIIMIDSLNFQAIVSSPNNNKPFDATLINRVEFYVYFVNRFDN